MLVFDFPPSANQTLLETVKTLANMAGFVILKATAQRLAVVSNRSSLVSIPKNMPALLN